jgi:hypothetical protein
MNRLPWNKLVIVLAMVALCHGQMEKALTLLETTAAIIGVQQYFRSGCVFFLYSNVRKHDGEFLFMMYHRFNPILRVYAATRQPKCVQI